MFCYAYGEYKFAGLIHEKGMSQIKIETSLFLEQKKGKIPALQKSFLLGSHNSSNFSNKVRENR